MNVDEFIINEQVTVWEAMQRLATVAKKVLFIVEHEKLSATLTDTWRYTPLDLKKRRLECCRKICGKLFAQIFDRMQPEGSFDIYEKAFYRGAPYIEQEWRN